MPSIFPSNLPDSLAGTISQTQDNVIGSPEKHDLSKTVKSAYCYSLTSDEAGLAGWIASNPKGTFPYLGEILRYVIENGPIWIEGDFEEFSIYSGFEYMEEYLKTIEIERIGFLFFKEDNDILGCSICWEQPNISENDVSNLTISPIIQHIDVKKFEILDNDLKPTFIEGLLNKRIHEKNLKQLGNLYESLSSGISNSVLSGIVDDASIINQKENDREWKDSYIRISASFSVRLIFLAMGSLVPLFLFKDEPIKVPGYLIKKTDGLIWRNVGNPKEISNIRLSPFVTGQVTLKTVVFSD